MYIGKSTILFKFNSIKFFLSHRIGLKTNFKKMTNKFKSSLTTVFE